MVLGNPADGGLKLSFMPHPVPEHPPLPPLSVRSSTADAPRFFPYPAHCEPFLFDSFVYWRDASRRKPNDFHNPLSSCCVLGSVCVYVCICYLALRGKGCLTGNCRSIELAGSPDPLIYELALLAISLFPCSPLSTPEATCQTPTRWISHPSPSFETPAMIENWLFWCLGPIP